MPLNTLLELALLRDGPTSGARLAVRVGARKANVLRELRTNPRFDRSGAGRYSTWRLAGTGQEPTHGNASAQLIHLVLRRLEALESRVDALAQERRGS